MVSNFALECGLICFWNGFKVVWSGLKWFETVLKCFEIVLKYSARCLPFIPIGAHGPMRPHDSMGHGTPWPHWDLPARPLLAIRFHGPMGSHGAWGPTASFEPKSTPNDHKKKVPPKLIMLCTWGKQWRTHQQSKQTCRTREAEPQQDGWLYAKKTCISMCGWTWHIQSVFKIYTWRWCTMWSSACSQLDSLYKILF